MRNEAFKKYVDNYMNIEIVRNVKENGKLMLALSSISASVGFMLLYVLYK